MGIFVHILSSRFCISVKSMMNNRSQGSDNCLSFAYNDNSLMFRIDFLGNRRSAVLRRIFCAEKSVSSAALLGVMQGRDTKPGAKETSKTVLRKSPRKSNDRF